MQCVFLQDGKVEKHVQSWLIDIAYCSAAFGGV